MVFLHLKSGDWRAAAPLIVQRIAVSVSSGRATTSGLALGEDGLADQQNQQGTGNAGCVADGVGLRDLAVLDRHEADRP